jgi:DNA-binding transcriptional LysR family regulator
MTQNSLRNLDMGTLRSFVSIAESGSMTRAASRLFMTQSAISMQIKRLETALGLSVFERSAQGMSTTSEGEQLLQFANQMLALNDEAMGRLTSPDYEGVIRFGAPCDVVYPHVPGILKEFSRDFPRVQLRFSSGPTVSLKDQFEQGLQDMVLTTEREPGPGGTVVSSQPLIWTGAEDGSAWKKRPLPLGISKTCAFRPSVIEALDDADLDWTEIVTSEDEIVVEAMTSADLCIGVELGCVKDSGRLPIDHRGQLPGLPEFSTVLYCADSPGNQLAKTLAEYLLRAYA